MDNEPMNNESMDVEGEGGRGGRLKRRLKGVQKRRRVRRFDLECAAVALKMRLVKIEEDSDR